MSESEKPTMVTGMFEPLPAAPIEPYEKPTRVAVVGAGVMGQGIAQLLAQAGCSIQLYDNRTNAAIRARVSIGQQFDRLAAKGRMSVEDARFSAARVRVCEDLDKLPAVELVIEAIVEDLQAKQELFRRLESKVSNATILATNTSSLSVTALAAGCKRPERVAGLHFFNPVPLMRVVEIIGGTRTDPMVLERLTELIGETGHAAVQAQDTPGFVVNHAGRAYPTEALKILGENVAPVGDIDDVLREASGFKLGPFELLDLTALDVSHPVMESIYAQYYGEPRYRPSVITRQRLQGGLLGKKVGRGFYHYDSKGAKIALPANTGSSIAGAAPGTVEAPDGFPPVWVGGGDPQDETALRALVERLGAAIETADRPSAEALCLVCPLGWDASSVVHMLSLDPKRTVAIDPLHGFAGRRTLMTNPATSSAAIGAARTLLSSDGVAVTTIRDSPGFISQRVLAMVVNLGCDIVQQDICNPESLDTAVRLGLAYPEGPLAWGDTLGAARVFTILQRLLGQSGDPRYRPSPWLRRRARLGLSLLSVEGD